MITEEMIAEKWALGAMDRGHNHYSFAVITESEKMVVECGLDKELAEHIVEVHNAHLEKNAESGENAARKLLA